MADIHMHNMNKSIDAIISNDKDVYTQYLRARHELANLLDMINIRLRKNGEYCNVYTLTVASGIHGTNDSYLKH